MPLQARARNHFRTFTGHLKDIPGRTKEALPPKAQLPMLHGTSLNLETEDTRRFTALSNLVPSYSILRL